MRDKGKAATARRVRGGGSGCVRAVQTCAEVAWAFPFGGGGGWGGGYKVDKWLHCAAAGVWCVQRGTRARTHTSHTQTHTQCTGYCMVNTQQRLVNTRKIVLYVYVTHKQKRPLSRHTRTHTPQSTRCGSINTKPRGAFYQNYLEPEMCARSTPVTTPCLAHPPWPSSSHRVENLLQLRDALLQLGLRRPLRRRRRPGRWLRRRLRLRRGPGRRLLGRLRFLGDLGRRDLHAPTAFTALAERRGWRSRDESHLLLRGGLGLRDGLLRRRRLLLRRRLRGLQGKNRLG